MDLAEKYGLKAVALIVGARATGALLLAYTFFTISSHPLLTKDSIGSADDVDTLLLLAKLLPGLSQNDFTTLGMLALIIAILRFAEASGLWLNKLWGQWLGMATGIIAGSILMNNLVNEFSWFLFLLFSLCVLKVIYLYSATR